MATIFNWLDSKLGGYKIIRDPDNNEMPERPYLRFLGDTVAVVDDPVNNATNVTVVVDLTDATDQPTPNTLVKRNSVGGASFGGTLQSLHFNSTGTSNLVVLNATGLSTLSATRVSSLDVFFGGTSKANVTTDGAQVFFEGNLPTWFRTRNQTAAATASSPLTVGSGDVSGAGSASGILLIKTGTATGGSGNILVQTGNTTSGSSGGITMVTGSASGANTGNINFQTQTSLGAASGSVDFDIGGGNTSGSFTVAIAAAPTTGDFRFVGGTNGAATSRSNFLFYYNGVTPNLSGGAGVFYMAPCFQPPALNLSFAGMILWCDTGGNVWLSTNKGFKQLF